MTKFILPTLFSIFMLTGSTHVFAKDSNLCATLLSSFDDNRVSSLLSEDQNMIIISGLISAQLQLTTKAPVQITPTIRLLSALTEVKINGQDNTVFHELSLIDQTLVTVF